MDVDPAEAVETSEREASATRDVTRRPSRLRALFVDSQRRRLRALWRLLVHALVLGLAFLGAGVAIAIALFVVSPGLLRNPRLLSATDETLLGVTALLQGAITTAVTWLACRFLDRRPFSGLGLTVDRRLLRDAAVGLTLPFLMFAALFLLLASCGWLRVTGVAWREVAAGTILASLARAALAFVAVAWFEELLTRGYWFVNLREGTNVFVAVGLTSSIFAIGHAANPNVSAVALAGLVGAGAFLAWSVVRTGRLWMALALHTSWNFCQGTLFGFRVSGLTTFSLVRHEVTGPQVLTGGAFGPEAGLLVLGLQGLAAVGIWALTRGDDECRA